MSCAVSCRRQGLEVEILEKAKELGEVCDTTSPFLPQYVRHSHQCKQIGAGVLLPPNATRILSYYGLMDKMENAGAVKIADSRLLRYSDGSFICSRDDPEWLENHFKYAQLSVVSTFAINRN